MSDGPAKTASGEAHEAHEAHDEHDEHEAQIYKAKKTKKAKRGKKANRKWESLEEDNERTCAGPNSCHNDTLRDATSDAVSEGETLKKRKRVGDQPLVSTEATSLSTGDGSQRGDGSVAQCNDERERRKRDRSRIDQEITTITAEIAMVVGEIRIVQDQDEKRHLWSREESLRADKSKLLDERRYIINHSCDIKGIY